MKKIVKELLFLEFLTLVTVSAILLVYYVIDNKMYYHAAKVTFFVCNAAFIIGYFADLLHKWWMKEKEAQ